MMLLVSLMVAFLSPLTTLVVKSDSVPSITKYIFEFYEPIGQKAKYLRLSCDASGQPSPKIEFYFHANDASYGKKLINSSRIKRSGNDLIIKNVSASDTGTYRCYAINEVGRVFENQKIRVSVDGAFNDGANLDDQAVTLNVELGREQELICPVKSFPYPLRFEWGANKRGKAPYIIRENDRIHITENGDLYFSLITRKDVETIEAYGGISCIMNLHTEKVYSRKFNLKIEKDNASLTPPSLHVKLPGNTFLLAGEDHTLTCIGGGNPVPHITWFRNGEEITSNDSNFKIDPKRPGKLVIKEFGAGLAGNYKCSLSNNQGNAHSDGNLILAERPVLYRSLKRGRTAALLRRRLELRCMARGTNPITYEWYKNGRSLTSFENQKQLMQVNEGYLLIEPVDNSTEGTYQCYAINAYGNTFSTTYIYVQEPSVYTPGPVGRPKTPSPGIHPPSKTSTQPSRRELQLKYIIIIACSGAVFVVLVGGGVAMYCRSKDANEEIIFVPSKETGNNNTNRHDLIKLELSRTDLKQALLQDLANLPPPPPSLTDHSDDDFSSYGGYKSNHPLYYNDHTMMYLMNHSKEEHLYADIPEDFTRCESATPSTEL